AAEEVVEPDLVQRCRRRERGQVAADPLGKVVGAGHHGGGVPTDEGADPPLHELVAGEPGLELGGNGVDVGRRHRGREPDPLLTGALEQPHEQVPGTVAPVGVHHRVERVQPLERLVRVDVGQLVAETVKDEAHAPSFPPAPLGARPSGPWSPPYTPTAPAPGTPAPGAGHGPCRVAGGPPGRHRTPPTSGWRSRRCWRRCAPSTAPSRSSATPPTS